MEQLLEKSGAEGEVGGAERGGAECVERVAEAELPGRIGEKAEKTEGEIGQEEKSEFEGEGEQQEGEKPEEEKRSANEDTPEGDDVRSVGKFAAGEVRGEERRGVEKCRGENEGEEKKGDKEREKQGVRRERGFFGVEKAVSCERVAESEPWLAKIGGDRRLEKF